MSDDNKEGAGVPITDERAHEILLTMAHECDAWADGLNEDPTEAQCSGKALSIIMRELATPLAVMPAAPSDAVREYPPLPEAEDFMYQHEDTGITGFIDAQQIEWGFFKNNPRLQKVRGVYTEAHMRAYIDADRAALSQTMQPQAAQPAGQEQAGAVAFGFVRQSDIDNFPAANVLMAKKAGDDWQIPVYLAAPGAAIAAREQEAASAEVQWIEQTQHLNCPICGGSGHVDDVQPQGDAAQRALLELVMLKEMKDKWEAEELNGFAYKSTDNHRLHNEQRADYLRRQPVAWEAARRALASHKEAPATPQGEALIDRVAELMRGIDAYAYDYRTDGKLAASRQAVSNALLAAFNADLLKLIRTQPTTVQQADTDEAVREVGRAWAYAEGHEFPGESADAYLEGHRAAIKTVQTIDLPGGNGVWS